MWGAARVKRDASAKDRFGHLGRHSCQHWGFVDRTGALQPCLQQPRLRCCLSLPHSHQDRIIPTDASPALLDQRLMQQHPCSLEGGSSAELGC